MHRTAAMAWVVCVCASCLRLSQAKTLAALVGGMLHVQRVSLANLGRAMLGTAKHQIKQAYRFCANDGIKPIDAMRGVVNKLVRKRKKKPLISFDRTDIRGLQMLMAAAVIKGRAVPIYWASCEGHTYSGHPTRNRPRLSRPTSHADRTPIARAWRKMESPTCQECPMETAVSICEQQCKQHPDQFFAQWPNEILQEKANTVLRMLRASPKPLAGKTEGCAAGIIYFTATDGRIPCGVPGVSNAEFAQALGVPGTVAAKPFVLGATAIDTTVNQTLKVTAQWSVANAGNIARLDVLDVQLVSKS